MWEEKLSAERLIGIIRSQPNSEEFIEKLLRILSNEKINEKERYYEENNSIYFGICNDADKQWFCGDPTGELSAKVKLSEWDRAI
jgi:hypothetical protein